MGVFDGQPVNAAVTNPAFIDANADDTGFGAYTLANTTDPNSGAIITNIQALMNHLSTGTGATVLLDGTNYSSTQRVASGQNHETAIGQLDQAFHGVTGHMHTGAPGDGPPIFAAAVTGNPLRQYYVQAGDIAVTGTFLDISGILSGQVSTGPSVTGYVVDPPYNKVLLRQSNVTGGNYNELFTDNLGNPVYGRVAATGATRLLNFYTDQLGSEVPYDFPVTGYANIRWFYPALYNPIQVGAPVYDPLHQEFDNKLLPITWKQFNGNPLQQYYLQAPDISATGNVSDVSSQVTGGLSTGVTVEGLVVDPPYNKVFVRSATGANAGQFFTDAGSNPVYARLTATGANRALSYYSLISGTETPYSFPIAVDVRFFYPELFNTLKPGSPTYDNLNQIFDVGGLGGGGTGNSGYAQAVTYITGPTTPDQFVDTILADAATGGVVVSLPQIDLTFDKKLYSVKKVDAATGMVELQSFPGDVIDGVTGYVIQNQYDSVKIVADINTGSWWVL